MKRKDAAKAHQILAAAVAVAGELGIEGLSMEAVARRAGVATATLYVYHASKEALLEAAYLGAKQAMADAVFRTTTDQPVRPAFLAFAASYLDYLVEHHDDVRFLQAMRHSAVLTPAGRAASDDAIAPLVALLERGVREQLLKDQDPQLAINFLNGAMHEIAYLLVRLPRSRRAVKRDQAAAMCWDALAR